MASSSILVCFGAIILHLQAHEIEARWKADHFNWICALNDFLPSFTTFRQSTLFGDKVTLQAKLFWNFGEEYDFLSMAKDHIRSLLRSNISDWDIDARTIKCVGKAHGPYGTAVVQLKQKRHGKAEQPRSGCPCSIAERPNDIECQYAARLDERRISREKFLGLFCYEKYSSRRDGGELPMMPQCDEAQYPVSDFPRMQVPEHLKSPYSRVVGYAPPQFEDYISIGNRRWPTHHQERTGFAGRGHLTKFGPNPVLYVVVTSSSNGTSRVILQDLGNSTGLPRFTPGSNEKIGRDFKEQSIKALNRELGGCPNGELNGILKGTKGLKVLHKGYIKDPLNTDNAWMEGQIIQVHDANGNCFGSSARPVGERRKPYFWTDLRSSKKEISDYVSALIANYK